MDPAEHLSLDDPRVDGAAHVLCCNDSVETPVVVEHDDLRRPAVGHMGDGLIRAILGRGRPIDGVLANDVAPGEALEAPIGAR